MRIQPPKTKKQTFNPEEFKDFLLKHKVLGSADDMNILEFIKYEKEKSVNIHKTVRMILSMLPQQYYYYASEIFYEMLENGEI